MQGIRHASRHRGRHLERLALWDQLLAKAPPPMSENFRCSGTFQGGNTACSGDSSGPLVVALEDGS